MRKLPTTQLHLIRRRLLIQERSLSDERATLAAEMRELVAQGQASTAVAVQRALARQIKTLRRRADLLAQRQALVTAQQRLVERLLLLGEQAESSARVRRSGMLARLDWPALLSDIERLTAGLGTRLERINRLAGALEPYLLPHELAAAPSPTPGEPARPRWETQRVRRVIDGDTILLENGQTVRYIGIDAPELHGFDGKPEPWAEAAADLNRALVEGQIVRLERDVSERDRYGRLLRYVYVGDRLVNAELVRAGLAVAYTLSPDLAHSEQLAALEATAQRAGRGVWNG